MTFLPNDGGICRFERKFAKIRERDKPKGKKYGGMYAPVPVRKTSGQYVY